MLNRLKRTLHWVTNHLPNLKSFVTHNAHKLWASTFDVEVAVYLIKKKRNCRI